MPESVSPGAHQAAAAGGGGRRGPPARGRRRRRWTAASCRRSRTRSGEAVGGGERAGREAVGGGDARERLAGSDRVDAPRRPRAAGQQGTRRPRREQANGIAHAPHCAPTGPRIAPGAVFRHLQRSRCTHASLRRVTPPRRSSGCRSGAGTSATRCRGTARGSTGEFARREAFVRWPVHGNVLEALREGRLEVGAHTLLEPEVWITAPGAGARAHRRGHVPQPRRHGRRGRAGRDRRHCMFANGCFVTDGNHRFDDPDQPVTWQGFTTKGPDAHRRQRLVRRATSSSPAA